MSVTEMVLFPKLVLFILLSCQILLLVVFVYFIFGSRLRDLQMDEISLIIKSYFVLLAGNINRK